MLSLLKYLLTVPVRACTGNIIPGRARALIAGGARATARAKVNRGIIIRHAPSMFSPPPLLGAR